MRCRKHGRTENLCTCENTRNTQHIIELQEDHYGCTFCCVTFYSKSQIERLQQQAEQTQKLQPRTPEQYVPLQWKGDDES